MRNGLDSVERDAQDMHALDLTHGPPSEHQAGPERSRARPARCAAPLCPFVCKAVAIGSYAASAPPGLNGPEVSVEYHKTLRQARVSTRALCAKPLALANISPPPQGLRRARRECYDDSDRIALKVL